MTRNADGSRQGDSEIRVDTKHIGVEKLELPLEEKSPYLSNVTNSDKTTLVYQDFVKQQSVHKNFYRCCKRRNLIYRMSLFLMPKTILTLLVSPQTMIGLKNQFTIHSL
eukprot:CAMPEP_0172496334 /NCGR_PEP_ID=MMETSP1066-20121228/85506_1 /TAXON_ID=671091 /ORGANISM="Coscinodiscus wailesii, Strain CCMP2513" /LENGTH=108 /DNA_ID=CAMNT_0013268579 /DNA_START=29 /DNA_END=358 /DNA_ORIENTATION=+